MGLRSPGRALRRAGRLFGFLIALQLACAGTAFAAAALTPQERQAIRSVLPQVPAEADEALVARLLAHAAVETGQRLDPPRINRLWGLTPARRNLAAEFEAARAGGRLAAWLAALAPQHPDYAALQEARRAYALLVARGGWETVPAGPPLRPGEDHADVPALRRRLAAEGFLPAVQADGTGYDEALQAAVLRFQTLRGLEVDGIVGPATRGALNIPAATRLAQIEANLERLRWLPRPLAPDRLEVNSAAAVAVLFEAGKPVLSMRIAVGDLQNNTPMFASDLRTVVVNPPWNVPTSIANAEILPKAARDPGYLARNGFRFVDGRLQQQPGPGNSLGRIKFDFPSPYGVYLHDTPGKAVFARRIRTVSHGCMRLEKPKELALRLLAPQGWTAERLEAAIDAGQTQRIDLRTSTPLAVVYRTAFMDENGLNLWPDPYGWDRQLSAALASLSPRTSGAAAAATDCA
ncbi:MAG: murein L,D-transpeptidase [Phenylobacterium sp.]|uniref:L,D-transpeptidase family protein n=1 Tax=Phenylobacterium sp. TaxID=1871053 RepID=UPI00391902F9